MKSLIPIFVIAALSGCDLPDESGMTRHMQTMMGDAPGTYTLLPNTEDSSYTVMPTADDSTYIPVRGSNLWDLVVKQDEYPMTKDANNFLCAHFNVVTIDITLQGKFMLPYERTVNFGGQITAASRQRVEIPLPDFKTKTLLNISQYVEDKDNSTHKYKLISKISEICVSMPNSVTEPPKIILNTGIKPN